jgi:hypothetical protein
MSNPQKVSNSFVNPGLILWEKNRQEWLSGKKADKTLTTEVKYKNVLET